MESEELSGAVEATLCECGKFHVGDECGMEELKGDNFILEFEKLPADEHIQQLRKTIQQLRDDRWAATEKAELYKRKLTRISKDLPHVKEEISRQQFSVKRLKTLATQNHALLQSEFNAVTAVVSDAMDRLSETLTCDGSCVYVRQQFKILEAEHEALKAAEGDLVSRVASLEADLAVRIRDSESLSLHAKNRDLNTDQKLSRIQKELVQRESELKILKKDQLVTQRRLEDETEKLSQSQLKASKYLSECERIKTFLKHAQDESQKLMADREKLRKELDENNKEMVKLRSTVKEDVDDEMVKMMQDMDKYQILVEKRIQEEAEKDKDKMRKEFEQYVTEYRANENKLMGKMKDSDRRHKEMISQLYRDLEECKSSSTAREHDLQVQIKQLQNHMGNITERSVSNTPLLASHTPLPDVLRDKETQIRTLANEVQFYRDKVQELQRTIETLQRPASVVHEKVEMLETLVQKEVEERNQLMESFTRAREELTRLKQPFPHYKEERTPQDIVSLESLMEEQRKPKNQSSLESLAIYKKRSENKYGGFRPPESSAMDLADLQRAPVYPKSGKSSDFRSTQGDYKSNYGDHGGSEYMSEYPKSAKTDVSRVTAKSKYSNIKSAKSIKSLKSLKSHYTLENENGNFKLQERDNVNGVADEGGDDDEAHTYRSRPLPNKPTPPRYNKHKSMEQKDHVEQRPSHDVYNHMEERSPVGKYNHMDQKRQRDKYNHMEERAPQETYNHTERRKLKDKYNHMEETGNKENELIESLGRVASGRNPDRVPSWATRPNKKTPFTTTRSENNSEPDLPTPPWRKQKMSWAPQVETIVSKGDTPGLYNTQYDQTMGLHKSDRGKVGHSDGFMESHRSSPTKHSEMPRMSMMKSLNQTKNKHTSESSWKIYQQLKVGKQ